MFKQNSILERRRITKEKSFLTTFSRVVVSSTCIFFESKHEKTKRDLRAFEIEEKVAIATEENFFSFSS